MKSHPFPLCCLVALLLSAGPAAGQTSPYRGLWVGQATLNAVNEVPIPLDEDNNPIAPNPENPTPTADAAYLRILVHVNAAGQASLLKDVAVLNRAASGEDPDLANAQSLLPAGESDLVLITDPDLYLEVPPQPGTRIASSVFDFGDSRATEAVDAVVEAVAAAVTPGIVADTGDLNDDGDRVQLRDAQRLIGSAAGQDIVDNADVSSAFIAFYTAFLSPTTLSDIITDTNNAATASGEAETLRLASFYNDTRAVDMVNAIVAAAVSSGTNAPTVVHNVASAYADTTDDYARFLAGSTMGYMIDSAARTAVDTSLTTNTVVEQDIRDAIDVEPAVVEARGTALELKIHFYDDTRATSATELVLDAVIHTVVTNLPLTEADVVRVRDAAIKAGRDTLATGIPSYPRLAATPTLDYDAFVTTSIANVDDFLESAIIAAIGAVDAAISEKRNNGLFTTDSVLAAARIGATEALRTVYAAAARAKRTELPFLGTFAVGSGDVRPEAGIGVEDPPLGAAGLVTSIYMPANHPTNPFRHRRHPDHTTGFDITRTVRLDFDPMPDGPRRIRYGVDRVTGVYREEIFGLHKPLGPNPDTDPVGLKVEGTFELNRISLIDALNAL